MAISTQNTTDAMTARIAELEAALAKAAAATRKGGWNPKSRVCQAGAMIARYPDAAIDTTLAVRVCEATTEAAGKDRRNATQSLAWLNIAQDVISGYLSVGK